MTHLKALKSTKVHWLTYYFSIQRQYLHIFGLAVLNFIFFRRLASISRGFFNLGEIVLDKCAALESGENSVSQLVQDVEETLKTTGHDRPGK